MASARRTPDAEATAAGTRQARGCASGGLEDKGESAVARLCVNGGCCLLIG